MVHKKKHKKKVENPAPAVQEKKFVDFTLKKKRNKTTKDVDRTVLPAMTEGSVSMHDKLIDGVPMFPIPHKQRSSYCHYHSSCNCLEARLRELYGKVVRIPRLSVQHLINSVNPLDSKKVLPRLVSHGVTTENNISYKGLPEDNDGFLKEGMELYKLRNFERGKRLYLVRGSEESERRIQEIKDRIDRDEPVIASMVISREYDYDGIRSYRRDGITTSHDMAESHSVVIVGYGQIVEEDFECWIYLNSSGPEFGFCGGYGFVELHGISRVYYLEPPGIEEVGLLCTKEAEEKETEERLEQQRRANSEDNGGATD